MNKLIRSERSELKRAEKRYASLKKQHIFPEVFDMKEIIENVSHLIGKTIQLHPITNDFSVKNYKHQHVHETCMSGLLLSCEDRVYIAYRAVGSQKSQLHIIFHELAHLLLDHLVHGSYPDICQAGMDKLNISFLTDAVEFKRTNLTSSQEREAERFAIRMLGDYVAESKLRNNNESQKRWGF